jgi:RNA polymerase sigma-70 factor (ECF subfamily)
MDIPRERAGLPSGVSASAREVSVTRRLIERARAGDREAMDALFARCLPSLRRWASGRLPRWARDGTDTQDLVQETALRVFRRIGDFEAERPGALQAYLRQAVMNRIRNELRRVDRRGTATEVDSQLIDEGESPLEAAIGRENVARYAEPRGSRRLEAVSALDVRMEKTFGRANRAYQAGLFAELFNATNSGVATQVDGRSGSTFGLPWAWSPPRALIAGVRATFTSF